MSALADFDKSDAHERSEWRGADVTAGEVAERLMALNREHARHEHGHAATRTLNLLVAPADDVAPDALANQLAGLADRHPSRTIVVREHAAPRLDAYVAIDCTIGSGSGGAGHCHDMAELVADAERLAHAVVLDSGATSGATLPAAFGRAAALDVERVRDVAWLRLRRWRRHVAARFDDPHALALLDRVERVELRSCAPQQASALLLAGWIAARAGWRIERLELATGGWRGSARRADGGCAEIALDPPELPDLTGIHALALHAGDETIALRAPVAAPNPARAFAAALGMFDTATPGYAPALAALLDGMEAHDRADRDGGR